MNRSVKRSMERRNDAEIPTAIDSASQSLVTVRRVFPDSPASRSQAASKHFGDVPFLIRRLPDLAGGY